MNHFKSKQAENGTPMDRKFPRCPAVIIIQLRVQNSPWGKVKNKMVAAALPETQFFGDPIRGLFRQPLQSFLSNT